MAYYGSEQCRGCSAEDCVCCEVYAEYMADQRADMNRDPRDEEEDMDCCPECHCDPCRCDDEDEPHDELNESMDGDFDSGMASAGLGTDEDYNHYDYSDDTPLGELYGGE